MNFFSLLILAVFVLTPNFAGAAAPCTAPTKSLKMATLAPQGTSLYKGLESTANRIKAETQGCVEVKIYAGGTAGDEKDVVRKMRIGQLHGAALTGVGLGMIEPEIRVLELPFLFKDQSQIDNAYAQLKSYFVERFKQKQFELLGWAEVGFVQIFCRDKPINNLKDLEGRKMWMWEGDPVAKAMYDTLKVVPVPLAITDVLTSLQTGLIDCAYGPPLAAIAFQWHTKTKYMTKADLVNGTGGLILSQQAWNSLSAEEKTTIQKVIGEEAQKLTQQSRIDNQQSEAVLSSSGIQIITPDAQSLNEIRAKGQEVHGKLVGQLFPQTLLDKVKGIIGQ